MKKLRKTGALAFGFLALLTGANATAETAGTKMRRTARAQATIEMPSPEIASRKNSSVTASQVWKDGETTALSESAFQAFYDQAFDSAYDYFFLGFDVISADYWDSSYITELFDTGAIPNSFKTYQGRSGFVFRTADIASYKDLLYFVNEVPLATLADEWEFDVQDFLESGVYGLSYDVASIVHEGETAEIYIDVDDPLTIDQILANVTAQDLLGENVVVNCTNEEKAKYNSANIGTYKITVTATDKYGQSATCYLNIHIVDTVAPTVSLKKDLDFPIGSTLQFSNLSDYVSITDNGTSHGGTIGNPSFTLDGKKLTGDRHWSAGDVGNHTLLVTVADSSGNSASKSFTVTVRDTQAPVVSMKEGEGNLLIGLSRVLNFTEGEFLSLFQATDNVTPASEIVLDVEGSFIPAKVGAYDIVVTATDKAGNVGKYTCHVTVDADLPPVFILSDALIGATAEDPLSSSQIQSIVVNALYAGRTVSNVLIDDSKYQAKATTPGSYPVTFSVQVKNPDDSVTTENGSMTIRVTSEGDFHEESAWDRFCKGFVEFWQKVGNWFRGILTKWKFDCFITNEEWDARFPETETAE